MAISMPIGFAYDEATLDEGLAAASAKHGVTITVLEANGGGNWPAVELEASTLEGLHEALRGGWGIDADELSEWVRVS